MPASDWKKCFTEKSNVEHKKKEVKRIDAPKKKPIKKISDKKKKRLKENGSEAELFRKIWNERQHYCEICGVIIQEPKPESFAHRLGKGRYPEHRYNEKNVALVCSNGKCHRELDKKNK